MAFYIPNMFAVLLPLLLLASRAIGEEICSSPDCSTEVQGRLYPGTTQTHTIQVSLACSLPSGTGACPPNALMNGDLAVNMSRGAWTENRWADPKGEQVWDEASGSWAWSMTYPWPDVVWPYTGMSQLVHYCGSRYLRFSVDLKGRLAPVQASFVRNHTVAVSFTRPLELSASGWEVKGEARLDVPDDPATASDDGWYTGSSVVMEIDDDEEGAWEYAWHFFMQMSRYDAPVMLRNFRLEHLDDETGERLMRAQRSRMRNVEEDDERRPEPAAT